MGCETGTMRGMGEMGGLWEGAKEERAVDSGGGILYSLI